MIGWAKLLTAFLTGCVVFAPPLPLARAEPFLVVPRIPAEAVPVDVRDGGGVAPLPSGFELLAGRARWGALTIVGPGGSEVRAHAFAACLGGALFRTQITLSTLGVSFYREDRLALAVASTQNAATVALAIELRRLSIDGEPSASGGGGTFVLTSASGPVSIDLAAGPGVIVGAPVLFPKSWQAGAWLFSASGLGLGARLVGRATGPPSVLLESGWKEGAFGLRLSIDLDRGMLAATLGAIEGVAAVVSLHTHALAGSRTGFGLLEARP